MCLTNLNGLTSSKQGNLADFISRNNIKIVAVTESHLIPSISSSSVAIASFETLRNDVAGNVRKHGV